MVALHLQELRGSNWFLRAVNVLKILRCLSKEATWAKGWTKLQRITGMKSDEGFTLAMRDCLHYGWIRKVEEDRYVVTEEGERMRDKLQDKTNKFRRNDRDIPQLPKMVTCSCENEELSAKSSFTTDSWEPKEVDLIDVTHKLVGLNKPILNHCKRSASFRLPISSGILEVIIYKKGNEQLITGVEKTDLIRTVNQKVATE